MFVEQFLQKKNIHVLYYTNIQYLKNIELQYLIYYSLLLLILNTFAWFSINQINQSRYL